jgi:hypothetical protein
VAIVAAGCEAGVVVTGSEVGALLASLVAVAVLTVRVACCEPAVAGPVGFGAEGARSALAIDVPVSFTGLGTG